MLWARKANVGLANRQLPTTRNVEVPRIHHTSLRINQANTVKMVVMYNIAGRQIASHWVGDPVCSGGK